jgi:hypothetical protein
MAPAAAIEGGVFLPVMPPDRPRILPIKRNMADNVSYVIAQTQQYQ